MIPCIVVDTENMDTQQVDHCKNFMKGALLIDLNVYFGGLRVTSRMSSRAQLEGMRVGKDYKEEERLMRFYEFLIIEAPLVQAAQAKLAESADPRERIDRIVVGKRLFHEADA